MEKQQLQAPLLLLCQSWPQALFQQLTTPVSSSVQECSFSEGSYPASISWELYPSFRCQWWQSKASGSGTGLATAEMPWPYCLCKSGGLQRFGVAARSLCGLLRKHCRLLMLPLVGSCLCRGSTELTKSCSQVLPLQSDSVFQEGLPWPAFWQFSAREQQATHFTYLVGKK